MVDGFVRFVVDFVGLRRRLASILGVDCPRTIAESADRRPQDAPAIKRRLHRARELVRETLPGAAPARTAIRRLMRRTSDPEGPAAPVGRRSGQDRGAVRPAA